MGTAVILLPFLPFFANIQPYPLISSLLSYNNAGSLAPTEPAEKREVLRSYFSFVLFFSPVVLGNPLDGLFALF